MPEPDIEVTLRGYNTLSGYDIHIDDLKPDFFDMEDVEELLEDALVKIRKGEFRENY